MFGRKWKKKYEQTCEELEKWKYKQFKERGEVNRLESELQKLQDDFKLIHLRYNDIDYVEMAMDLFNKYCKDARETVNLADGRASYWYEPKKNEGKSWRVVPDKNLPDGYIRYVTKYEEPNDVCVNCGRHFLLL